MRRHIDLLVFAAEGNIYGAYASQVEELLSESVYSVAQPDDAPRVFPYKQGHVRVCRLAEYLCQKPAYCHDAASVSPSLIAHPGRILVTTNRRRGEYIGLLIQELLELASLPVEQIFPLPQLMAAKALTRLIWGVALLHDAPVILLDLEHL